MKMLFIEWNSFGNDFIKKAFDEAGIEVECTDFVKPKDDTRYDVELTEKLIRKIASDNYSFVFSFDYFPVVAVACKAYTIPYLSWIYDSPYIQLYSETAKFKTNYIFHFDQYEVKKLKKLGVPNIYYLPLSAPVEIYDSFIFDNLSSEEKNRFSSDVAFVGSMYTEVKQQLYRDLDKLDDYTKGFLDAIVSAQKNIYGYNLLEESLNSEIVKKLEQVIPIRKSGDGFETLEWVYADYVLARKLASEERREILEVISTDVPLMLSSEKAKEYCVKLFTHLPTPYLLNIQNMGKVDYYDNMPYVFKGAKINLNISLRSIRSGIPLRAMDIMGCGGFLLTNYQADFLEHFIPGEDFVYYDSIEDMKQKIVYYLEHDDERKHIAYNGYQKVKQNFTFNNGIYYMVKTVFGKM